MITNKYKLDELCDFVNGGAWTQKEYDTVGVKVVQVTNLVNGTVNTENLKILSNNSYEKYKKHELKENDLVIATVGSHPTQPNSVVGRASSIPKNAEGYLLNQNAVCIRSISKNLDQKYLVYLGKSELMKNYIIAHARGSANQVRMSISALKDFTHLFPDVDKQKKISGVLSAYDDLIENNLRRIALLEETAESIYKEWFVNFRFPGYEKCKLVDGIPDRWKKGKISDVATIDSGYAFKSKDFQAYGIPIVKIKNIENKSINIIDCDCVEKSIIEKLSKFKLECGDLLIAMTGATVGKIGIMPRSRNDYYLNQRVGRIKSKYHFNISSYIFCLLNTNYISNSITNIAKGAAQPNISTSEIGNIKIIVPEEKVLYEFEKFCSCLLQNRLNLIEQNEKLKEARDILIPKLIMGEIEV